MTGCGFDFHAWQGKEDLPKSGVKAPENPSVGDLDELELPNLTFRRIQGSSREITSDNTAT